MFKFLFLLKWGAIIVKSSGFLFLKVICMFWSPNSAKLINTRYTVHGTNVKPSRNENFESEHFCESQRKSERTDSTRCFESPTDLKSASRHNFDPFQRAVFMFASTTRRLTVIVDHNDQILIGTCIQDPGRFFTTRSINNQRSIENEAVLKIIHQTEDSSGRIAVLKTLQDEKCIEFDR